jgi:putative nucleotidyltransferase with HDIG domain
MSEELLELIPEFDLIADAGLRDKCIKVWEEGMKRGGWRVQDLPQIAQSLHILDAPTNLVEHTRVVTLVCVGVADVFDKTYGERNALNRDYLIAGALLHDVGKLLEYRLVDGKTVKSELGVRLRHTFTGVVLAAEQGLPDEVLHMIAAHAKEGDLVQRSREATILHHADFTSFETFK